MCLEGYAYVSVGVWEHMYFSALFMSHSTLYAMSHMCVFHSKNSAQAK